MGEASNGWTSPDGPLGSGAAGPAGGNGWDTGAVPAAWGGRPVEAAPRPGVVPLRPLGLGELLDGAVALVRGYPGPALGASAVVALVGTLVQLVVLLTALAPLLQVDEAALEAGDVGALAALLGGALAGFAVSALVAVVTGALLAGAMTALAGRAVLGRPCSVGQLWAELRPSVGRLVGAALLVQLLVFGAPVLSVAVVAGLAVLNPVVAAVAALVLLPASLVLSVVLYVRLALAPGALVLEGAGVLGALRRSSALVRGSFWRLFGVLLLTFVVAQFAASVLQVPFLLFSGDSAGGTLGQLSGSSGATARTLVLSTVGAGVASFLVSPFVAGVRALLYVDRRMRAEGLDVALQAAAATDRSA